MHLALWKTHQDHCRHLVKTHRHTHIHTHSTSYWQKGKKQEKNSPEFQRHGQLHLRTQGETRNFNFWWAAFLFSLAKSIFLPDWSHFQTESSHVQMQLPKLNTCDSQPCLHSILSAPETELVILSSSQGLSQPPSNIQDSFVLINK